MTASFPLTRLLWSPLRTKACLDVLKTSICSNGLTCHVLSWSELPRSKDSDSKKWQSTVRLPETTWYRSTVRSPLGLATRAHRPAMPHGGMRHFNMKRQTPKAKISRGGTWGAKMKGGHGWSWVRSGNWVIRSCFQGIHSNISQSLTTPCHNQTLRLQAAQFGNTLNIAFSSIAS